MKTTSDSTPTLFPLGPSYGPAFLERLAGKSLLRDPLTALSELLANAWDAGASKVTIGWPTEVDGSFYIRDNGEGMSRSDFLRRWYELAYDRRESQPQTVAVHGAPRRVYGRNGVGRFAAFCFGSEYEVITVHAGLETKAKVTFGTDKTSPFRIHDVRASRTGEPAGTVIAVAAASSYGRSSEDAIRFLSMRFLTDESFSVELNSEAVSLGKIPDEHLEDHLLHVDGVLGPIPLIVIDPGDSDKTTRFHGFAFKVGGRFVGEPSWELPGIDQQVDGRRALSKRLLIVCDITQMAECVLPDWTAIDGTDHRVRDLSLKLSDFARSRIEHRSEEDVVAAVGRVREATASQREAAAPSSLVKWDEFAEAVARTCPSIRDQDVVNVSKILAELEQSKSKFGLIEKLASVGADDLDSLGSILDKWSISDAEMVLDEMAIRFKLLQELRARTSDPEADEVQELQPLFHRSLWIFGPEFESIEFTSNRRMNTAIRQLFGQAGISGSHNRPDFVIRPDGTVGCYSIPRFGDMADGDAGEMGVAHVVIVELKAASVPISTDEKAQCWKYVKEFLENGIIDHSTKVQCFALGNEVDQSETGVRTEMDGNCKILPLPYDVVIRRAESRLFHLYDKLQDSPFLAERMEFQGSRGLFDAAGRRR